MHLPEPSLDAGCLGRLGRELGARVDVVQRQVPPHVAEVAEVGEQLADDGLGLPAERALEVAVLDERHRRLERAADVVVLGVDRDGEVDQRLQQSRAAPGSAAAAAAAPSPGRRARSRRTRHSAAVSTPELRLVELGPVEGEARDQQRHGEADPRDEAAARHRGPADGRPQPAAAQSASRATTTPTMPTGLPTT